MSSTRVGKSWTHASHWHTKSSFSRSCFFRASRGWGGQGPSKNDPRICAVNWKVHVGHTRFSRVILIPKLTCSPFLILRMAKMTSSRSSLNCCTFGRQVWFTIESNVFIPAASSGRQSCNSPYSLTQVILTICQWRFAMWTSKSAPMNICASVNESCERKTNVLITQLMRTGQKRCEDRE